MAGATRVGPRELSERLEARREEIEQAILARVCSFEDPGQSEDPSYLEGLRRTVTEAVSYGLEAIERGEARPAPIPTTLFAQARYAAREGVSLDTVLRRYLAGYTLLGDFLHQEAANIDLLEAETFQRLRRDQAAMLDRVLGEISEEYRRETDAARPYSGDRREELVRRLLAGELLDADELGYELDGWHLGAVASGAGAETALRDLARLVNCRPLVISRSEEHVWAWLGAREEKGSAGVARAAEEQMPEGIRVALGEPAKGMSGWRFTHRQAVRAWPLTQNQSVVRYGEVALLATIIQDDVLATSLRQLYLTPLGCDRDGDALRETLRTYLSADCNVSSAASVLEVSRRTVANRLRRAESRLGRPIRSCAAEIEVALRLDQTCGTSVELELEADCVPL